MDKPKNLNEYLAELENDEQPTVSELKDQFDEFVAQSEPRRLSPSNLELSSRVEDPIWSPRVRNKFIHDKYKFLSKSDICFFCGEPGASNHYIPTQQSVIESQEHGDMVAMRTCKLCQGRLNTILTMNFEEQKAELLRLGAKGSVRGRPKAEKISFENIVMNDSDVISTQLGFIKVKSVQEINGRYMISTE